METVLMVFSPFKRRLCMHQQMQVALSNGLETANGFDTFFDNVCLDNATFKAVKSIDVHPSSDGCTSK